MPRYLLTLELRYDHVVGNDLKVVIAEVVGQMEQAIVLQVLPRGGHKGHRT